MSFWIAQTVEQPSMNFRGFSSTEKSPYLHRSIVPLTVVVIISKTRAAAPESSFPVTELIPSGSRYHIFLSTEYSLAASSLIVGLAPPLVAGSTKIVYAGVGLQMSCTCTGRAFGDFMSQNVLPVRSISAIFLLKITSTPSPA